MPSTPTLVMLDSSKCQALGFSSGSQLEYYMVNFGPPKTNDNGEVETDCGTMNESVNALMRMIVGQRMCDLSDITSFCDDGPLARDIESQLDRSSLTRIILARDIAGTVVKVLIKVPGPAIPESVAVVYPEVFSVSNGGKFSALRGLANKARQKISSMRSKQTVELP